jgi:hypothetical protein
MVALLEVRAQLAGHDTEFVVDWAYTLEEAEALLARHAADLRWRNPRIVNLGELPASMAKQPRVRTTE